MDVAYGGRRRTVAPSAAATGGRRDREEDLTLFKEMVIREKERNVSLLQPVSAEFEQPFNGIYPYPLYRIPSRKQGLPHDLLPAEGEKNDYDWLKTPPATPLFPSIEMEANNPNLVLLQREIAFLQHPGPSRFAGKRSEEPRPIHRQKPPAAPSSTSSSRTVNPAPSSTANYKSSQTAELKREAERRRAGRPPPRGREEVAAGGVDGGAAAGKLVLGSRMVEKVVNARRSAAAAAVAAEGGGREKGVQPKGGGGLEGHPPGHHGSLPPRSSHDMVVKHAVGTRKKPTGYNVHQRQEQAGCPKGLAPKSNRPASASTLIPGHESKEDRNLLKIAAGRRRCALC